VSAFLHQSPIRIKVLLQKTRLSARPFPLKADQKIFGSMPCPNGFSQILWFLANPLLAHDMGSKDADNSLLWVERITNHTWWLFTNPTFGSPLQPLG
jgi:hypothetical protein